MQTSSVLTHSWQLFRKEMLVEVRTKSSMTSFLLFSFISLFLVSLSMGSVNSNVSLPIKAALYWIIIFFSSLSTLDKAFIQEKDRNTFLALRLYVPAQAVFLGKLLYNFVLLLVMSILLGLGFVVLMDVDVPALGPALLVCFLGAIGIASAGTLLGALVAFTSNQNYLFAIISFPIFLPIFLILIQVLSNLLVSPVIEWSGYGMILAYDVLVLAVSSVLFDYLWYE